MPSGRRAIRPPDDLLDALGNAERLERERARRRARLTDVRADLLDEERIAVRLAPDAVHESRAWLEIAARVDELGDLVLAQAREL